MLIDYLVTVACLSTIALIWRAFLLDHPYFALKIKAIPLYIGEALYCGFCFPLWLALFMTFFHNPLPYSWPIAWLTVGAGVLVLRNLTALLMEANGYVSDLHRSRHRDE